MGLRDSAEAPAVGAGAADVLIIGGGPAGSSAAALLARRGHAVTLLEKDHHPRFHIGESLLPANLPLFAQLGVAGQMQAIGMEKWGAEFVSPWDGRRQDYRFAEAWDKGMPFAYHVRRSEFDEILLRNAARAGANVLEGWRARQVRLLPQGAGAEVDAQDERGQWRTWRARFLVDASGRDTLLATQFGYKRRNPRHNSAALFAHFAGAQRYAGERAGYISLYWFDHGWFWLIPLRDGITSVGAVIWPYYLKTRRIPVQDFFLQTVASCAPLAERLHGAQLVSEVQATGNYSYRASRSHGSRYLLLGDAYCFIDPVFSSGVLLAMQNAFAGAEAIDTCLRHPRHARAALRRFDRHMRHGPEQFSWFIYRITQPTMRELFMAPANPLRMKEALLSLLAGDIFGRTPMWGSLRAFKLLYAILSLAHPRRSLRGLARRRLNVRAA